jgi:hypothetical protein
MIERRVGKRQAEGISNDEVKSGITTEPPRVLHIHGRKIDAGNVFDQQ